MLQVSNGYLKLLLGPSAEVPLEFVKEMPKPGTRLRLDISSLLSAQFFTYVIIALFPVSMQCWCFLLSILELNFDYCLAFAVKFGNLHEYFHLIKLDH